MTYFSECIPIIKRRISVVVQSLLKPLVWSVIIYILNKCEDLLLFVGYATFLQFHKLLLIMFIIV